MKDFQAVDMLFSFISASTDEETGYIGKAFLATVHKTHLDPVKKLLNSNLNVMRCASYFSIIREFAYVLKRSSNNLSWSFEDEI